MSVQKYRFARGALRLNPLYVKLLKKGGKKIITQSASERALAFVSDAGDIAGAKKACASVKGARFKLSSATKSELKKMMSGDAFEQAGVPCKNPERNTAALLRRFSKYKAPIGAVNRLHRIYGKTLVFIVDDSDNMNAKADGRRGARLMTRWRESELRLKRMAELAAFLPVKQIRITFFNREDTVTLDKEELTPARFVEASRKKIAAAFAIPPAGAKPAYDKIRETLENVPPPAALYLMATLDGAGGPFVRQRTFELISACGNSDDFFSAFLRCGTFKNELTELPEDGPFGYAADEYADTLMQFADIHGAGAPYTYGMWLVEQLCGADRRKDAPMSKDGLENMLGSCLQQTGYNDYLAHAPAAAAPAPALITPQNIITEAPPSAGAGFAYGPAAVAPSTLSFTEKILAEENAGQTAAGIPAPA